MTFHPEHDLLSAYADGELDASEHAAVESHLAGCAAARTELDAIRATIGDLAALDEPAFDPQIGFAIRSALARERKLGGRARRYAWAGGAAAAALVGILVFTISSEDGTRDAGGAGMALTESAGLAGDLDEAGVRALLDSYTASVAADSAVEMAPTVVTTQAMRNAEAPAEDATARAAAECLGAIERESEDVRLIRSFEATYKGEPVYIFVLEVPATEPERVEAWVTTRDTCTVRYFTQADR